MGQRHQIFINTLNGAKFITDEVRTKLSYNKKLKAEFGEKDTTVLAYHHQWLYGISAVIQALHLLEFNRDATPYVTPFKRDGIKYGSIPDDVKEWVNSVTGLVSMFIHPLHRDLGTGRIGIERVHYLNSEQPDMRNNFDHGDNNDGITIIDTVTGKYCFMVLSEYQCVNNGRKPYQILSAVEYARDFYYPTDPAFWSEYDKSRFPGKKMQAEIKRREKKFRKIEKAFRDFRLMTAEEIVDIWPNYANHCNNETVSSTDKILFHATSKSNRNSILSKGLEPRCSDRFDLYTDPRLCLFSDPTTHVLDYVGREGVDIWEVRLDDSYELFDDPCAGELQKCYYVNKIVPADRIRIVQSI